MHVRGNIDAGIAWRASFVNAAVKPARALVRTAARCRAVLAETPAP
jgi:hypothetical protein